MKFKSFCKAKETTDKMKRQATEWEKIYANDMTNKGVVTNIYGLPQWHSDKESTCNAGAASDVGSIPGSGRSPGERYDYPLQYSCLENPTDGGAWQAGGLQSMGSKSRTRLKWLNTHTQPAYINSL